MHQCSCSQQFRPIYSEFPKKCLHYNPKLTDSKENLFYSINKYLMLHRKYPLVFSFQKASMKDLLYNKNYIHKTQSLLCVLVHIPKRHESIRINNIFQRRISGKPTPAVTYMLHSEYACFQQRPIPVNIKTNKSRDSQIHCESKVFVKCIFMQLIAELVSCLLMVLIKK